MSKEKMLVEAICNGTVLDHIPSDKLFKIVTLLGLDQVDAPITIGCNLDSRRLGSKGIIKISDHFFSEDEINRIAILAPDVRLSIIRDYEVIEKKHLSLPASIVGLVRCGNAKCITNAEPMPTRFETQMTDSRRVSLECHYCGRKVLGDDATLI